MNKEPENENTNMKKNTDSLYGAMLNQGWGRTFTMLCPKCQRRDKFWMSVHWEGEDKRVDGSLSMRCPHCNIDMYDADDLLIPALSALNKHGIVTRYHCAVVHEDGYFSPSNPEYTQSTEMVEWAKGTDLEGVTWYRGPYIIFTGITHRELLRLDDVLRLQPHANTMVDYRNMDAGPRQAPLPWHAERIHPMSNIVLLGAVTKVDEDNIKDAVFQLNTVISRWLDQLNHEGIVHDDRHHMFDYMANDSWSSHRAKDEEDPEDDDNEKC